MKIYIVAWEYNGGGGFDWYTKKKDAIKAIREERKIEIEFKKDKWTAFYFEIDLANFQEEITNMLDGGIVEDLIQKRKR